MKQSLVTFGRAIVLLLLAWKIEAWLVPLLLLAGIEEAQLKTIVAITQWGLYIVAVLLLLVNWWRSSGTEASNSPSQEALAGYDGMPDPPVLGLTESQEDEYVDQNQQQIEQDEAWQPVEHKQLGLDQQKESLTVTIHDLPAPPEDFVGRETEIKELLKRIRPDKSHILCLQSAEAGVGKSALILKLAEQLTTRYPDAQLFMDMRGSNSQPLSSADVMSYVMRQFGMAQASHDESSLQAAYQRAVQNKRILLVLDDVANKEQIEPLLLPTQSALLMTSRQIFTLPGLYVKRLSPFSPDEAREFLLQLTPRIAEHAGELATLCGLLPLSLRLAAGVLANREDIRPEEYIWQLRDPGSPISRLTGAKKILQLSYNLLDETEQHLWHKLAIFPDHFNALAARAIWQSESTTTQETLDTLVGLSLVEQVQPPIDPVKLPETTKAHPEQSQRVVTTNVYSQKVGVNVIRAKPPRALRETSSVSHGEASHSETEEVLPQTNEQVPTNNAEPPETTESGTTKQKGSDRYCLHKQARLFANAYLSDEERATAIRHHAKHFEQVLREANKEEIMNAGAGQALFDEAWPNIKMGQSWAMQQLMSLQGEEEQKDHLAIALCSTYPEAGGALLEQNLPPQEHIRWLEAALMASRHLEQPIGESTYLGQLGQAYSKLAKHERALDLYEQQLKIAQTLADRDQESRVLGHIGQTHHLLGQTRQAISSYEQQLMVIRNLNDNSRVMEVLGKLGNIYSELGQIDDAISCYQKQLASSRQARDLVSEVQVLGSLGHLYSEVGHIHSALNYYERQLEIGYSLNDQAIQCAAFGKLGNLYADSGDLSHALTCYKEQLLLARHLRNRKEEGSALGNIGITYAELGEMGQATRYCEQALQIDRELGDKRNEAIGAWNLGLIYEHLGNFERAIQLLQIAVQYERSVGDSNADAHAEHLEAVRQRIAY